MRYIHALIFVSPAFLMLGSCATISKKSCMTDSWYDVGFKGAIDNHDRADHISDVTNTCGKLGISVELDAYESGVEDGTRQFCEPSNGYQWGLKGRNYNGICANPAFSAAYSEGQFVYKIEQRRSAISSQLSSIRSRLGAISKELDAVPAPTADQKQKLNREYDKLLLERSDLTAEQYSLPRV